MHKVTINTTYQRSTDTWNAWCEDCRIVLKTNTIGELLELVKKHEKEA